MQGLPQARRQDGPGRGECQPADFRPARGSSIVSGMPEIDTVPHATSPAPCDELGLLLAGIQRKDRGAFESFYELTVQPVYSLALRITRRHETAEEVVSDVYMQIWRQAGDYDPTRGKVLAWLSVVCRSRALDTLRRTRATAQHESVSDSAVAEVADSEYPQDLLMAVEEQGAVHSALRKLDEQQRQLLALAYFRGYSHSELAQFTGLPLGTVKTQLRRSLILLKSILSGGDSELGETR